VNCDRCGCAYWPLARHYRCLTKVKAGPFECSLCARRFAKKEYLLYHSKCHFYPMQYHCPNCWVMCSTERRAKDHRLLANCQKDKWKGAAAAEAINSGCYLQHTVQYVSHFEFLKQKLFTQPTRSQKFSANENSHFWQQCCQITTKN